MRAEDRVRVQHMIDAVESAMQFIAGRERADLDNDRCGGRLVVGAAAALGGVGPPRTP